MTPAPVSLSSSDVERILAQEVRKFGGRLPGYDQEDLRQEVRFAVFRRLSAEHDGARAYVRLAARHRLSALLRQTTTASRCPHDPWGRPQILRRDPGGIDADHVASPPAAEEQLATGQAVSYLKDRLDPRDWRQLLAVLEGEPTEDPAALADARLRAAALLGRIGYRVKKEWSEVRMFPQPDDRTPACHPDRKEPQGYDPDPAFPCADCRDKFTCLPRAIEAGLVKLTQKADLEVDAVLEGRITFADAVARMKRRVAKKAAGSPILPEDRATWPMLDDADAPIPAIPVPISFVADAQVPTSVPAAAVPDGGEGAEAAVEEEDDVKDVKITKGTVYDDGARVGTVRKAKEGWGWYNGTAESPVWYGTEDEAAAALVRYARKHRLAPRKASKPTTVSMKKPAKPKAAPALKKAGDWPLMSNGKPLPRPSRLTEEEMQTALADAQSKLGANIVLEYGMTLVRRKREGDVVTTITPNGFAFTVSPELAKAAGFSANRQVFGSLSSVAMWAERRMVSGNDFFNLVKHNCTEVRKGGRIIDRKGGVGR